MDALRETRTPTGDFDALVRAHHRRLMAFALALVRQPGAAEDLVQDALLTAHRSRDRYDASRDFGAWVRGILRMKFLERARARRLEHLDEGALEALEARHRAWDEADRRGRGDVLAALRACRDRLPGPMAEVVTLFYQDRLECAAIAARLGTNEVAVRKRLQRARDVLGDCLRRSMGDDA